MISFRKPKRNLRQQRRGFDSDEENEDGGKRKAEEEETTAADQPDEHGATGGDEDMETRLKIDRFKAKKMEKKAKTKTGLKQSTGEGRGSAKKVPEVGSQKATLLSFGDDEGKFRVSE